MFFAYGIVDARHFELDRLNLGEGTETLCCIVERDLAMLCDETAEDSPMTRETTRRYTEVLCGIIKQATIVPVRFGTLFDGEEEIRKVLRDEARNYRKLLSRMDNKIEVELKVWWKEENFIRTMLVNKRLSRWKKALEEGKGEGYDVVAFGQAVQGVADQERKRLGEVFLGALRPLAEDYVVKEATDSYQAFDGVFLVNRKREEEFDTAVGHLYDKLSDDYIFKYTGPWAPHHFVSS